MGISETQARPMSKFTKPANKLLEQINAIVVIITQGGENSRKSVEARDMDSHNIRITMKLIMFNA